MYNIQRLPGAKTITGILWAVLLAGLLAWLVPRFLPSPPGLSGACCRPGPNSLSNSMAWSHSWPAGAMCVSGSNDV